MNEIEKEWEELASYRLPKTGKYMWILDAANGSIFKFEIPRHFPDNGNYEELVMSILQANEITQDVRIQDCSWQEATGDVQVLNSRANGQYW